MSDDAENKPAEPRVAVIAVHGVADQKAGETARALAELLVAAPPATVRYAVVGADELALRVESLRPSEPAQRCAEIALDVQPATPSGPRPLAKAMAQSVGSDMHREQWVAQPRSRAAPPPLDPGVALTDFLLFKAVRNETPPVAYDSTRLQMRRGAAGREQRIDVHEMYWADLSRLASGVPRILTELFTLLFRLSQLGRDTVATAARQFAAATPGERRWRWLAALQAALDWGFAKGLALLTTQLLMAALLIVLVGLALGVDAFAGTARRVLALLLPVLGLLWFLYRFERRWPSALAAVAAIGALAALLAWPPAHWVVGVAMLAALSLAYDWVMRVCDARFPMTRFVGWSMWSAVMLIVLASAALLPLQGVAGMEAEQGLRIFSFGALRAIEFVLAATVVWWGIAGLGLLAWLLLGQACARTHGFEGGATVATGRLGLFVSMGLFVVLSMAAWASLTPLLDASVAGMHYRPLIFRDASLPGGVQLASVFLDTRYRNSTETFSLLVLMLLALGLHLVVGFFPSLLAEMKLLKRASARLGRWLTIAYRYLDLSIAVVVVLAVFAATVVGIALNSRWFGTAVLDWLNMNLPQVGRWSQQFLKPLVWTTASITVAITALGGVLSRYVPWLRAPLDIALDIDSHFREFPRQGIPRARIFSRYAALLQHVAQQDYERIVIVSHSQGTVISAELLRYLKARAQQCSTPDDAAAQLWRRLEGRVHLLTLGCPLRQLYASRFATLYRWVLHDDPGLLGPSAAGIGVQRWVNAYTSGDYVGRWLWSRPPAPGGDPSDTMIDEVSRPGDVYAAIDTVPDLAQAMGATAQLDVCLGVGAHTHYFEPDQHRVAALVDQLIVTPWPAQQARAADAAKIAA
ncbi:MAG TPA: hypothetical protein VJ743_04745 [Albitalea sp.]|nr:hypothetical protein [Albitalea sp.]